MRIGIVGCGANSDYHINFARSYKGATVVGVADSDLEKAQTCAERHGIDGAHRSIEELVARRQPDVLHVVVPPARHHDVAMAGIRLGCHVLVEKPMAFSVREAEELYGAAERKGVKICPVHNHNFDPCMMLAREVIGEGRLGQVVGVESYYGLNTGIDAFRKYPAPHVLPWLYSLPGGIYHDFLPHPLYVMLPYIGRPEEIEVMERSYGVLPHGMTDEVRVLLKGSAALGTLVLSFAADPHLHYLRLHGTKMMIDVDFNTMTTTLHPVSSLPKAAQKATYNLGEALQLTSRTVRNVVGFLKGSVKPYQGMERLIHCFYGSLEGKVATPVAKEETLQVIEATQAILRHIKNGRLTTSSVVPLELRRRSPAKKKVLVTGASGFLGKALVDGLIKAGYDVRAFVRRLSDTTRLEELRAEIAYGDVADPESLESAFKGVDLVVHAAADTAGGEREGATSTIQGTANVLRFCRQFGIGKLVYISSCNVYEIASLEPGSIIFEDSLLERHPERRGPYTEAKLAAEGLVRHAMARREVRAVCLRPGTIFGPGGPLFTPMLGFSFGSKVFLIIGNGRFLLPLIYVGNLVQAILLALAGENGVGRTYNVIDPYRMSKRDYAELLLKPLYPNARYVYIPYLFVRALVLLQERLCRLLGRRPFLTDYRLESSQKAVLYDASRIARDLDWRPSVSMRDAIDEIVRHEKQKVEGPRPGAAQSTETAGSSDTLQTVESMGS